MEQFNNNGAMKGMPVDFSKPIVPNKAILPHQYAGLSKRVDIRVTAEKMGTTVSELGKRGAAGNDPAMQSVIGRLAYLRQKGEMDDKDAERLYKMMTDHRYAALDVLETLKVMQAIAVKSGNVGQINLYTQRINDWSKLYHGEKIKVESTNVNVNINASMEEWERRLHDDNDIIEITK